MQNIKSKDNEKYQVSLLTAFNCTKSWKVFNLINYNYDNQHSQQYLQCCEEKALLPAAMYCDLKQLRRAKSRI